MAEFYNSRWGDSVSEEGEEPAEFSTCPWATQERNGIQKCGPPVLLDENKKGLGFWGNLYCPYCGERCDFILIDFDHPVAGASTLRAEINMREWREDFLKCPKCGYAEMELLRE